MCLLPTLVDIEFSYRRAAGPRKEDSPFVHSLVNRPHAGCVDLVGTLTELRHPEQQRNSVERRRDERHVYPPFHHQTDESDDSTDLGASADTGVSTASGAGVPNSSSSAFSL